MSDANADYRAVFGRDPEPWRMPLGALRLTLTGEPGEVDVERAQHEVEWLARVLNGVSDVSDWDTIWQIVAKHSCLDCLHPGCVAIADAARELTRLLGGDNA